MNELKNLKKAAQKTADSEPKRTIEFWRERLTGMQKKIFAMVVFEKGYDSRDRLTKSQVDFLIDNRKNKRIG